MGQALSSCAPCCSSTEDVEPFQMNPQWKEKIKTNSNEIVLAVDPNSTEEEIAAETSFGSYPDADDELEQTSAETSASGPSTISGNMADDEMEQENISCLF